MRKITQCIINVLILIVLFSLSSTVYAATYYTTTSGSDSNSGTQSSPFKTLKKGASVLKPGDTLLVGSGTYAEALQNAIPGGTSWSSPVTIKAASSSKPILKPSGTTFVLGFGNSSSKYIVIDSLILDGANIDIDTVKIQGGANHIRIINSEVRNATNQGILISGTGSDYNEFINNHIHHNGTEAQFDHGIYIKTDYNIVDGNIIESNASYGVHIYNEDTWSADNNIVRNNRIFGHTGKPGMILSSGKGNTAYNNFIYNNYMGVSINYNASGTKLLNNTFYKNSSTAIYVGSATGTSIVNNIIYSNGSVGTAGTNSLTTDPKFVNASSGDLHLQSSSPAINNGTTLTDVKTDIDGGNRPVGSAYDIGADEYGTSGGGTQPTQPQATATPIPPTRTLPTSFNVPTTSTGNFNFNIKLHGIGSGGDNANPQGSGNYQINRPQRALTAELYNGTNQLISTKQVNINFSQTSGMFTGSTTIAGLANGGYTLKLKSPQYLNKQYPGIIMINGGQQINLQTVSLTTGDINADNNLSVLDYNLILDCFADIGQPRNCSDANKKVMADLTDDGSVNQFDYNLFLRELSVQTGQ